MARTKIDIVEQQLHLMWIYLGATPRSRTMPLSEQIKRDAELGNVFARRLLGSRIFQTPADTVFRDVPDTGNLTAVSVAVSDQPARTRRESANAAHGAYITSERSGRRQRAGLNFPHSAAVPPASGPCQDEHARLSCSP